MKGLYENLEHRVFRSDASQSGKRSLATKTSILATFRHREDFKRSNLILSVVLTITLSLFFSQPPDDCITGSLRQQHVSPS